MPRDSQPTRNRILQAAEQLFAENGYDGVSIREIATLAEVRLALIHYHFGTKLDVYRAIWANRYTSEVAQDREAKLSSIDYGRPRAVVIRELVEVFLLPLFRMKNIETLKHFMTIGAREVIDPKEAERGVLAEFLDPPARRFLACFRRTLPELSAATVAWGYQAMVGISILHIADRGRITRISNGKARSEDSEDALKQLVEFCIGGWLMLAEQGPKTRASKKVNSPTGANKSRK